MSRSRTLSARWRLLAPLTAAGAVLLRPALGRGQESTPVARSSGVLDSLLSAVPVSLISDQGGEIIASFADVAGQLAVVGATRPESVELDRAQLDEWLDAISPLAVPGGLRDGAFIFTRDQVGFDLTDIDAALEAGGPPNTIWVLRGRFDHDRLRETWAATGYRTLDVEGMAVFSLSEDGEMDLTSEVGSVALGKLNNAALLPDGSLVFTPTLDLMKRVLATARGDEPALNERIDIRALLDAQTDQLVTGVLFNGLALAGQFMLLPSFEPDPKGTPALFTEIPVDEQLPPIALGLLGITGGGALPVSKTGEETPDPSIPDARVIYSLLMLQPGSADLAGEIASARLETMDSIVLRKPYREIFASWETESLADGQVLRLEITMPAGTQAGMWSRFLYSRDVLFLGW